MKEPSTSGENLRWTGYIKPFNDKKWNEFLSKYGYKKTNLIEDGVNFYIKFIELLQAAKKKDGELSPSSLEQDLHNLFKIYQNEVRRPRENVFNEIRRIFTPIKGNIQLTNESCPKELNELKRYILETQNQLDMLFEFLKDFFSLPENKLKTPKVYDILYVEDDVLTSTVVTRRVEKDGFKILCVPSPERALRELEMINPRLILLDIGMPPGGMQGDELCLKLKSRDEFKNIPIFLISAYSEESDIEGIKKRTKADGIYLKPIDLDRLKTLYAYLRPNSHTQEL